jgi:hypothetical protein
MLYFLFALVTATTAVAVFIEAAEPSAFWPGALKVFTLWMQVRHAVVEQLVLSPTRFRRAEWH